MSKKTSKDKSDENDEEMEYDSIDEDFLEEEFNYSKTFDKKYDKDNEDYDKKFRKKIKHKTEDRSTVEGVLDLSTSKELYKLQMNSFLNKIFGIVSTGKESNVYYATSKDLSFTNNKTDLALKIFRTRTLDFKKIKFYIDGDLRFSKSGKKSYQIIQTWAMKEYKNLLRAFENGISVPQPFLVRRNILIMEFLGEKGNAAPQLRNVRDLTNKEMQEIYLQVFNQLELLWSKANLVHGDLSAYNILYFNNKIYFIDMGQSVLTNHNFADAFLLRDIENLLYFFSEYEINTQSSEEIFEKITQKIPDRELLKLKK